MSNVNNAALEFKEWRKATDWFPVIFLSAAPADWAGVVLSVGGCSAGLMASSCDCASALSPQSGKVAAKLNHLVTLRRCEEARRPLEDSAAGKTSLGLRSARRGLDSSFTKGADRIKQMFRADAFASSSSDRRTASPSSQSAKNSCGFIDAAARVANVAVAVKQILQAAWRERWRPALGFHFWMNLGTSASQQRLAVPVSSPQSELNNQ